MIAVLKLDNLSFRAKFMDIRKLFNEHGFRPEDIHFIIDDNGRHIGSAFVVFKDLETARGALIVDGCSFFNRNIAVMSSNPREFNKFFPGKPLINVERRAMNKRNPVNFQEAPQAMKGRPDIIENRSRMFASATKNYGSRDLESENPRDGFMYSETHYQSTNRIQNHDRNHDRDHDRNHHRDHDRNHDRNHDRDHNRNRSRSPHRGYQEPPRDSFSQKYGKHFDEPRRERPREERRDAKRNDNHGSNIDDRRFVRVNNLPYNVSDIEIQKFFKPLLTRDVFYLRHESGKLAGKPNGCVIVEFYSESDARQALKLDGKRFGQKTAYIIRAIKEDILQSMQGASNSVATNAVINSIPDVASVASNPQVQHLINLLTATVTNLTGSSSSGSAKQDRSFNDDRRRDSRDSRKREVNDPVISRVATSANIDVGDINMGRVVGIRNLPYSVTPGEILQFFEGYHAIPDSVRIHYLEDGRCSGDAIISFRNNRDATRAVGSLNKRTIARRKIELFFL